MLKSFNDFARNLEEGKKKPGPDSYMTGLSDSTQKKKEAQMKKQADMSDDDPDAYKPLPGDTKAKDDIKTSAHTKNYDKLYGKKEERKDIPHYVKLVSELKQKMERVLGQKIPPKLLNDTVEAMIPVLTGYGYEIVNEEDEEKFFKTLQENVDLFEKNLDNGSDTAQGDRTPIGNDAIETGLKNKSEDTGVPIGYLRIVMRRGMAAWKTGHRPGAGQEQWGYARVNSFLTKSDGTWGNGKTPSGGADSDVAREVVAKGHDKKMK
jgi:hypothetical protein